MNMDRQDDLLIRLSDRFPLIPLARRFAIEVEMQIKVDTRNDWYSFNLFMETLYLETTGIGHLTGRLLTDPIVASRQQLTRQWWTECACE